MDGWMEGSVGLCAAERDGVKAFYSNTELFRACNDNDTMAESRLPNGIERW